MPAAREQHKVSELFLGKLVAGKQWRYLQLFGKKQTIIVSPAVGISLWTLEFATWVEVLETIGSSTDCWYSSDKWPWNGDLLLELVLSRLHIRATWGLGFLSGLKRHMRLERLETANPVKKAHLYSPGANTNVWIIDYINWTIVNACDLPLQGTLTKSIRAKVLAHWPTPLTATLLRKRQYIYVYTHYLVHNTYIKHVLYNQYNFIKLLSLTTYNLRYIIYYMILMIFYDRASVVL